MDAGSRIEELKKILEPIFEEIPQNRHVIARKLIDRIAFMTVAAEDLESEIIENGYMSEYKNGENQFGMKKSPALESYIAIMQRYNAAAESILKLFPASPPKTTQKEGLLEFMKSKPSAIRGDEPS